MDGQIKIERQEHPRNKANFFSIITFSWLIPIFVKGLKKDFQEEDLFETLKDHESSRLGDKLEAAWKKELNVKNPSLVRALGRVFILKFAFLGCVLFFIEAVIKIIQPLALGQLITYYTVSDSNLTKNDAYVFASLIVGSAFLNVMFGHLYMLGNWHLGMQIRVACCSLIYRKSLKLSKTALKGTTVGQMVNLISNDVSRFDTAMNHIHCLWVSPIETTLIVLLLYFHLGFTATLGAIFLILFIPVEMFLGKKTSMYRLATAFATDERVRLMEEIISGIHVIKMYTWEKPFLKLVSFVRKREIKQILSTSYIRGFMLSLKVFAVGFSIYICILAYSLSDEYLTARYVFVLTSYYNILRITLAMQLPNGITEVAEATVSIRRIKTFLLYEEKDNAISECTTNIKNGINLISNGHLELNGKTKKSENPIVRLKDAFAKWSNEESDDSTLSNINLNLKNKKVTAIIGQVGSGKTSLFHVILRELPLTEGCLEVKGKISYASQEPWLFGGSIRQNILFGNVFDPVRYEKVVKVCALERDFSLFEYEDRTLVGERGVSLSGGQRARINLARAVYREADIYLLDDPLSAVDTHVGKYLFDECISKFLQDKIVILVTHQLQYLKNADRIIVLDGGKIIQDGKYNDIKNEMFQFLTDENNEENSDEEETVSNKEQSISKRKKSKSSIELIPEPYNETKAVGSISSKVYWSYFRNAGSGFSILFILSLFIISQASIFGRDYFVTYWTNVEQDARSQNFTKELSEVDNFIRHHGLYIYSFIIFMSIFLPLIRSFLFYKFCTKASQNLHDIMFSKLVSAKMEFFNVNPSGRILNRFSKDIGNVDEILPVVLIDSLQIGFSALCITLIICIVNYWLVLVTVFVFCLFYMLRIVYLATSRSIKRLEGITRSPVFTHLNSSLQGLTTIRAFGAEEILNKEFDKHQNLHSTSWYMFIASSRAFGFWLDLICVIYVASVTFSFLFKSSNQYGGDIGLSITQVLNLTGMLQWGMRQWSELENQMTSVERVIEYTQIETEPKRSEINPSNNWPENGKIQFKSVFLKYFSHSPYVLKNLNFVVQSKEKVGIVGRTGAGKSSIIAALFQLTETEGQILIDDLDITKMPLDQLRSKISIIPQEPVLFSGSLRKNLDPFDEYPDEVLWKALEQVRLKNVVVDLTLGLNTTMSEKGSNFSVGQRQLLCLARAIIRKHKILILDEATANVDHQTDKLIQETIREQFNDCTVLTVAHRLNTIMDSDKVLVLDGGEIKEFDSPYNLLQNEDGLFYSLVENVGNSMMDHLVRIAQEAHENKKL